MKPELVLRLWIIGRVQGVGFRQALRARALQAGATGWVRNRSDGSVEAQIEGSEPVVRVLAEWAQVGPAAARVTHVAIESVPAGDGVAPGFDVRTTL